VHAALGNGNERTITMSRRFLLFVLALMLISLPVLPECLQYEPASTNLCGKIVRLTYPGPPNYESIKAGDLPETYWYLFLDNAVCVEGAPGDDVNVGEKSVKEIQLVLSDKQYQDYKGLIGKRACVAGSLFHAITGHHHRAVLITVKEMKAIA
jgi:hypothetical protein